MNIRNKLNLILSLFVLLLFCNNSFSQVNWDQKRYVQIGTLQSRFLALGSERAWNHSYYEGLQWPADYSEQDNAVIKRSWIAAQDFIDEDSTYWDYWATYMSKEFYEISIFPIEIKQSARFARPTVTVDGQKINNQEQIDNINPNQIADRIITNTVNTSLGLTLTRRIYVFSHPNHDDYFIKKFIFKNTGNTDFDDEIELSDSLKAVRIGWQKRYSVCREGAKTSDNTQSWGAHSWITKRGENYPEHYNETIPDDHTIADWIRCGFSWFGQSKNLDYDNIGSPDIDGSGRLTAPQFAGLAVLHVDKNASDHTDDPNQPTALGWHAGDHYPSLNDMSLSDSSNMKNLYKMLQGNPFPDSSMGGTNCFFEENTESITDQVDPFTIHGDIGGTNVWICYGPYDLAHGDSIVIVEAEGINGLNREQCLEIGSEWLEGEGPYSLPDGSTTNDRNLYKNSWFYTGIDSLLLTFSRAKRNFDLGYNIPKPPPPPSTFDVSSGDDYIHLKWNNNAEDYAAFAGYKLYRRVADPDSTYNLIFECGNNTNHPQIVNEFNDTTTINGVEYYYYISTYDDGSKSNGNPLHSNRFWTITKKLVGFTSIENNNSKLPDKFTLYQNYPNPFNPLTTIKYSLSVESEVRISIYNMNGNLVETIVNDHKNAGNHYKKWDASGLASGVYFYKIQAGNFTDVKKCLLMK
ncbi:MAG: T9SS type A sorting domain-containing protein [Candidatus Marinimicrobia bacterium]|nr:T9SS type A sorting domain-containing protein [Candidatus Neomarinimicrobiota bacterium]